MFNAYTRMTTNPVARANIDLYPALHDIIMFVSLKTRREDKTHSISLAEFSVSIRNL